MLVAAMMTQIQGVNAYEDDYDEGRLGHGKNTVMLQSCAGKGTGSGIEEYVTAGSTAVSFIMMMMIILLFAAVVILMRSKTILVGQLSEEKKNSHAAEVAAEIIINKAAEAAEAKKQRHVCSQSMCTYNRRLTVPRFVVLNERETEPHWFEAYKDAGVDAYKDADIG